MKYKAENFAGLICVIASKIRNGEELKKREKLVVLLLLARPVLAHYRDCQFRNMNEDRDWDLKGDTLGIRPGVLGDLRFDGAAVGHGLQHGGVLDDEPFRPRLRAEEIAKAIERMAAALHDELLEAEG